MLQLNEILKNRDAIVKALAKKHFKADEIVDKIILLDKDRREAKAKLDSTLSESNRLAAEIGKLYKSGNREEAEGLKVKSTELKELSKQLSEKFDSLQDQINKLIIEMPNTPCDLVPEGKNADDNVVVRMEGEIPDLQEDALPHWELAKKYNIIDFELGNKVTGAGFPFYRGLGARLQRSLVTFFLNTAVEKGFTESLGKSLKNQYPQALRRILNLYLKLWLVMIPYIILQYFTAGLRLTWIELLGNATTLVNTLNGTWWFVFQYVQMLLIAPVLAMVFHHFPDKKQTFLKWGILIGCALLYKGCGAWLRASFPDFYSFAKERIHPAFLLCYFSGYLLARYHLIESFLVWVEKITGGKLIPQAILGTCFLMLTLILRVLYATGPMAPTYDFFFTPCLTLGMILFSRGIGWLRASLSHLGKCSTYMWFLHIFTYAYTKEWIGLYLSSHIAFYIFQVILAMLVSMIFLWVDHSISTALHKSR